MMVPAGICQQKAGEMGIKTSGLLGAAFVAAALLSGCVVGPVYQQTPEPGASVIPGEVTLLLGHNGDVQVRSLDGKVLANPLTTWNGYVGIREIHMTPGRHTFEGFMARGGVSAPYLITDDFNAGAIYQLTPVLRGYELTMQVTRVDEEGKQ
jgi:hypothetical protein